MKGWGFSMFRDKNGKLSWMRVMSIPVLLVGLFMLVWGTLFRYDVVIMPAAILVCGVLGLKGGQSFAENKRE